MFEANHVGRHSYPKSERFRGPALRLAIEILQLRLRYRMLRLAMQTPMKDTLVVKRFMCSFHCTGWHYDVGTTECAASEKRNRVKPSIFTGSCSQGPKFLLRR